MGKQHRSFGKDMEMLAEAYNESSLLGGAHMMQGMGVADQAAAALAHDDGYNSPEEAAEDKTGDKSDAELIKKYTYKDKDGEVHLTDAGRDALSKAEEEEKESNEGSDEGTEKKKPGDWSGKGGYYANM